MSVASAFNTKNLSFASEGEEHSFLVLAALLEKLASEVKIGPLTLGSTEHPPGCSKYQMRCPGAQTLPVMPTTTSQKVGVVSGGYGEVPCVD